MALEDAATTKVSTDNGINVIDLTGRWSLVSGYVVPLLHRTNRATEQHLVRRPFASTQTPKCVLVHPEGRLERPRHYRNHTNGRPKQRYRLAHLGAGNLGPYRRGHARLGLGQGACANPSVVRTDQDKKQAGNCPGHCRRRISGRDCNRGRVRRRGFGGERRRHLEEPPGVALRDCRWCPSTDAPCSRVKQR